MLAKQVERGPMSPMGLFLFAPIFFLAGWTVFVEAHATPFEIRTVVTQLSGEGDLGRSVATVLSLQLWQTLRKAPDPNPKGLDFGDGTVLWRGVPLPSLDHDAASNVARDTLAQQTLWGSVRIIDDQALVTTYLTIPDRFDFRSKKNEIWVLNFVGRGDGRETLSVDIPQRAYAFEPIVLPKEFVAKYSTPDALRILSAPSQNAREIGTVGSVYKRLANDGDYARLQSGQHTGWVYLPQIGSNRPEIIDFVAAIIRIFRSDWAGAKESFNRVIGNREVPASIRADSLLYLIRAKTELHENVRNEIETVLKLAPASRRAVQYAVMHHLTLCGETTSKRCGPAELEAPRALLARKRALFAPDDAWYTVAQLLTEKGFTRTSVN